MEDLSLHERNAEQRASDSAFLDRLLRSHFLFEEPKPEPAKDRDPAADKVACMDNGNPFLQRWRMKAAVIDSVGLDFEIPAEDLKGKRRGRKFAIARSVICTLLREAGLSTSNIGMSLGGRDHSTVCHSSGMFDVYAKMDSRVTASYLKHKRYMTEAFADKAA